MKQSNHSRQLRTISSLLLFTLSTVLSLVLAEVILRLFGYAGAPVSLITNIQYVNDSVLDWRYIPHSVVKTGRVINRYNNTGFRDVDHSIEKSREVLRLMIVGDSVTEGSGVEWKSVFAYVLQDQLSNKYEIINLAMSGLNTIQEVHLLKTIGLKYKPDVVVLNFILNDCDFNSEFYAAKRFYEKTDSEIGLLGMPIEPRVKRLLKSSALIYFVKERIENLIGRITGKEESNYFVKLWGNPDNRRQITTAFDELQFLQAEQQFEMVVIIWPLIVDYTKYALEPTHRWIKHEVEARGFATIDLLQSFSTMPYRDLQVTAEDNVHPNALGHKLAAQAFLNWLMDRNRLPPR